MPFSDSPLLLCARLRKSYRKSRRPKLSARAKPKGRSPRMQSDGIEGSELLVFCWRAYEQDDDSYHVNSLSRLGYIHIFSFPFLVATEVAIPWMDQIGYAVIWILQNLLSRESLHWYDKCQYVPLYRYKKKWKWSAWWDCSEVHVLLIIVMCGNHDCFIIQA